MTIKFFLMLNRQGKTRLSKWYVPYQQKERERIIKELAVQVTHRSSSMCNFIEWREFTVVYKRYASLYFVLCVDKSDNELITLELIHRFVFILDKYFGNVTELDLIYDFSRAYLVLDELLIAGEQQESSAAEVLRSVDQQDELHKAELVELAMNSGGNAS
ncbi:Clathrin assembly protein AP19 [Pelomyxa schiedti]|nr:Clathrin assembly protein AP19 [Pelomyxa schiedti]